MSTAAAERRAKPASRLDSSCHQVPASAKDYHARHVVRSHRCGSWFCGKCGWKKGRKALGRMIEEVSGWEGHGLLTLTVDREKFEGPEAAFDRVSGGRLLGKLMAGLRDCAKAHGVRLGRFISVLEFQPGRGNGWPHWHILLETSRRRLPKALLQEAWRIWRDRFGVGGLDWNPGPSRHNARLAVGYVCK